MVTDACVHLIVHQVMFIVMPLFMKPVFGYKYIGFIVLAVVLLGIYVFLSKKAAKAGQARGPAYDLIFAVSTFDPNLNSTVSISPYIIDGTLYIACEKLPPGEGTTSSWVSFYRYNSRKRLVEQLPSPTPAELAGIQHKESYALAATKGLELNTDDKSPDGYALAEPNWVKVNPISNVLGNILLFFMTGGFEDIKEREGAPRLAKGAVSLLMPHKRAVLKNEADNAFMLGWIIPEHKAAQNPKK